MSPDALARLATNALYLSLRLAAPVLLACALAALVIGMFQAATRAEDPSLGFVSKLVFAAAAVFFARAFMTNELLHFSAQLFHQVAQVAR